jgi:predicted DNA-binding transcriptional regulator AlpA
MQSLHGEPVIVYSREEDKTYSKSRASTTESDFLNIDDVVKILPVSKPTLYRMIKKNEFPKPIKLTATARGSLWVRSEVNSFIEAAKNNHRVSKSLNGLG